MYGDTIAVGRIEVRDSADPDRFVKNSVAYYAMLIVHPNDVSKRNRDNILFAKNFMIDDIILLPELSDVRLNEYIMNKTTELGIEAYVSSTMINSASGYYDDLRHIGVVFLSGTVPTKLICTCKRG